MILKCEKCGYTVTITGPDKHQKARIQREKHNHEMTRQ